MSDYPNDLNNARDIGGDIVTAGQPSRAQLQAAAAAGVHTVINLRPAGEFDEYDESALVAETGMRYVLIPVAGPDDINDANAQALDDALSGPEATPALVHCASSNRVGALIAYRARHLQGTPADEAMQLGLAAGLNPRSPLLEATRAKLG
ncbi:beta-lactamase hydrolase domain-containing protein [Salinisphaera sp. Q1T1-3]|uniref:beta-lactamase hydrolase domain-containing protein n=1 Tax=Salinisphaera sp. Q1T1-3 TaxID=2321229 RepID=UPI0013147073|nr:sulfur transferase domain-containing protein [Salinisphaera sp. Q1T1-3]